ncbi:hypothetical protein PoB_001462000 [Plakobranchus ocellatus]|uniref:Uncharacterized protein n=1 Tax=Plakobranchus ocellatus TaxID=259542 RepID=A0AAV3YY49_9GAST|nr:hypothetical protein PoB_001462000 [Plakobranchus ocellatus]
MHLSLSSTSNHDNDDDDYDDDDDDDDDDEEEEEKERRGRKGRRGSEVEGRNEDVGGTVASETAFRSAGTPLWRARASPAAP